MKKNRFRANRDPAHSFPAHHVNPNAACLAPGDSLPDIKRLPPRDRTGLSFVLPFCATAVGTRLPMLALNLSAMRTYAGSPRWAQARAYTKRCFITFSAGVGQTEGKLGGKAGEERQKSSGAGLMAPSETFTGRYLREYRSEKQLQSDGNMRALPEAGQRGFRREPMTTDFSQAAAARSAANDAVRHNAQRVEANFCGRMSPAMLSGPAQDRRGQAAGHA